MNRLDRRFVLVLSLFACWACSPSAAQVTRQGNRYLLRMKFTPGQTMKYIITSEAKMPQGAMVAVIPLAMTVKSVQGKIATIQMQTSPMSINGKPTGRQSQTVEIKLDDRGTPIGGGPGSQVATQFPDKPLAVGETFSTTKSIGVSNQQLAVNAVNKFEGIKKVGSRSVAIISTTITGTGALNVKGTGVTQIDVADGSLVSIRSSQHMTISQGQQQTVDNSVTIIRK